MSRPRLPAATFDAEQQEFMAWARKYYGPRAEEYLARSGPHFLFPPTVGMFEAWLAARWAPEDRA